MACQQSQKVAENARNVSNAVTGIKDGTCQSVYSAARAYNAPVATVNRHVKGGQNRAEARHTQQYLFDAEEKALVQWITSLTMSGYPPRHGLVREIATKLRNSRDPKLNNFIKVGPPSKSWTQRFSKRHSQHQTKFMHGIEV